MMFHSNAGDDNDDV